MKPKKLIKILIYILVIVSSFSLGFITNEGINSGKSFSLSLIIRKPLEKYSIENLINTKIPEGKITKLNKSTFEFEFSPDLSGKRLKKTTGQILTPEGEGKFPIVILIRGYVDREIYKTGVGTSRAASVLSSNNFITIAPDFLGYAGSDAQAMDVMESRFQTYTTILSLLESLDQIEKWDKENVFIWAHSNGGQIALTTLEVTDNKYPTTLWAPVTKPFPYSILYYTDELDDRGKYLRGEIANFEKIYDVDKYSIENYISSIRAPLQLHQGSLDDAVPMEWSDEFVEVAEKENVDINYYKYSGADHNLRPSWDTVISRDIEFFESFLK